MRLQRLGRVRPSLVAAGAVAAVAMSVAACGGGSTAKPSASAAPTQTSGAGSPMPTAGAAAQSAVKAAWVEFFNARTPTARRVALLENGQSFSQVLASQAAMPMAASATARVSKVVMTSPTQAKVTYTVLVAGKPVLSDQTGVAVYQDGTWRVGVASFCGLLAMESGGKTSSLPAACHGGG